jgi:hypothetical protein
MNRHKNLKYAYRIHGVYTCNYEDHAWGKLEACKRLLVESLKPLEHFENPDVDGRII